VPERVAASVPAGERVLLAFGGVVAVVLAGMLFACIGAFSLLNPALPLEVRFHETLDWFFARHWFLTLPCMAVLWGGCYMLVTAVLGRKRGVLNSATAVVLMWVVVVSLVGWLVWR
jgi:hypothetical protein